MNLFISVYYYVYVRVCVHVLLSCVGVYVRFYEHTRRKYTVEHICCYTIRIKAHIDTKTYTHKTSSEYVNK